jgi:hypothetical protein
MLQDLGAGNNDVEHTLDELLAINQLRWELTAPVVDMMNSEGWGIVCGQIQEKIEKCHRANRSQSFDPEKNKNTLIINSCIAYVFTELLKITDSAVKNKQLLTAERTQLKEQLYAEPERD